MGQVEPIKQWIEEHLAKGGIAIKRDDGRTECFAEVRWIGAQRLEDGTVEQEVEIRCFAAKSSDLGSFAFNEVWAYLDGDVVELDFAQRGEIYAPISLNEEYNLAVIVGRAKSKLG